MTTQDSEAQYTICQLCDFFVEQNYEREIPAYVNLQVAEFVHLDNGEVEHDHDALPTLGVSLTVDAWRAIRPDLFVEHRDGRIGPNSRFHVTR